MSKSMKLEVIRKGLFVVKDGVETEAEIGSIVTVEGDKIPANMLNKVRDLSKAQAVDADEDVVNVPQPSDEERQKLLKAVAMELVAEAFTDAGLPKVKAVNAELDPSVKFTGEEIAKLYPGIKDAVEAERNAKVG